MHKTMFHLMLAASLCGALPCYLQAQSVPRSQEEQAVRTVVERYLHGLKFNDTTSFHSAFWPNALLLFVQKDATLGQLTQGQWYAMFAGSAGKEEQGDLRIEALDITGDAASVKVVEVYPKSIYTDYLNLLRVAGQWKIVNKIYTSRPR
jgi:hypothetical protein